MKWNWLVVYFFVSFTPTICIIVWHYIIQWSGFKKGSRLKHSAICTGRLPLHTYIHILIYLGSLYLHRTAISHYIHSPRELCWHLCWHIDITSVMFPCCPDTGDVKSVSCLQDFSAPNPTRAQPKPPSSPMLPHSPFRVISLGDTGHFQEQQSHFEPCFLCMCAYVHIIILKIESTWLWMH